MMPGHRDDQFDSTDRCWYKKDNQPRSINYNIPALSSSSSSDTTPFGSPYSSQVPSSKSPSGTRSASRTRSPGAPSTSIITADLGHGHTSRGYSHNHRRGTRQGSSTQPLADASNSPLLARGLDSEDLERRRRQMHLLSPPTSHGREGGLLQGTGTPPNTGNTARTRGRKSRDHQRPTHRSSSTPAGGNQRVRKDDAMRAWYYPTQPLPPGESWYIRRRDPPHPKLLLDAAKANINLKPTRRRRASAGSATLADTLPVPAQKEMGVMKGWYTAVCKKFGVVGSGSGG